MDLARSVGLLPEQGDLRSLSHRDFPGAAGYVEHPQRVAGSRGRRYVAENGGYGTYLNVGVGQQVEKGDGVVDACIAVDDQSSLVRGSHTSTLEAATPVDANPVIVGRQSVFGTLPLRLVTPC